MCDDEDVPVRLELDVPVWLPLEVPVGDAVEVPLSVLVTEVVAVLEGVLLGVNDDVGVGPHWYMRSFASTPPYCSDDWNCAVFSYTALQWPLTENSACWASPTAGMYCVAPGPNVLLRLKRRWMVKGVSRVSTLPHEQYGGTLHAAAIVPVHTSAVP